MTVKYIMPLELINEKFNIWKSVIDLPTDLISKVYDLQKKDPIGYKKSNYGGWHSKSFVYTQKYNRRDYSWIVQPLSEIDQMIKQMNYRFSRGWFNINSKGNSNNWHHHGHHPFVGVLYISVPENSGDIEFEKDEEFFYYTPISGDFVAFPGKLMHRVLENQSDENRISLAMNFSA
jgi:hypothetical protein